MNKIKGLFLRLDLHTVEVIKKAIPSLLVKVLGMAGTFVISIILGRSLGVDGLGVINLSNQIVSIVLIFSMFGVSNILLKEVAIAYEEFNIENILSSLKSAFIVNISLAIVFSVFVFVFSPWISRVFFHEPALEIPLAIAMIVIVPQVTSRIYGAALNGIKRIWQSNLVNDTLSNFIIGLILIFYLIFNIKITLLEVSIIYVIGRTIVAITVYIYWKKYFPYSGRVSNNILPLLKQSFPLLITSATILIAVNADTIMLGWLSNASEVGLYSVASRLAFASNFLLVVSISSISSKIATLYNSGKVRELEVMLQKVTGLLLLSVLLISLIFVFFGESILLLWGPEFVVSYIPLLVLSFGQFVNVGTGSTGTIMMMTGHEKAISIISIFSAFLNLTLNFFLIPKLGALGAALATTSSCIFENVSKYYYVNKKIGISTIRYFSKQD